MTSTGQKMRKKTNEYIQQKINDLKENENDKD